MIEQKPWEEWAQLGFMLGWSFLALTAIAYMADVNAVAAVAAR